jgi:hypothetical protein
MYTKLNLVSMVATELAVGQNPKIHTVVVVVRANLIVHKVMGRIVAILVTGLFQARPLYGECVCGGYIHL